MESLRGSGSARSSTYTRKMQHRLGRRVLQGRVATVWYDYEGTEDARRTRKLMMAAPCLLYDYIVP